MNILVILLSLGLLMAVAYRGMSVILFAPICALLAVALSLGPDQVLPVASQVFMKKTAGFLELYFPVFLLGAIFGKTMEISGAAASLAGAIIRVLGLRHVIPAVVLACAVLTYGGVSLFVVAFAIYPLAAVLFRQSEIPKRLLPATIALGSFTFTMDALPGTPQIQNIIPTTFFGTTIYAAPILGCCGAAFILATGLAYLHWCRQRAAGEGYGEGHLHEPETAGTEVRAVHPLWAAVPLLVVALVNFCTVRWINGHYGKIYDLALAGMPDAGKIEVAKTAGIWAIEAALSSGIVAALCLNWRRARLSLSKDVQAAVAGALLAGMNTASEYGFGGVIAALPGFVAVKALVGRSVSDPLLNEALSVNVLAGVTGSASGGLSLALAALGKQYQEAAAATGIDPQVLHRVASMASGGMDTLPHNGAVITLLLVTGMSHRQSYKNIFAITCLKTCAVFLIIAIYRLTGIH